MDWDDIGFIKASYIREKILIHLGKKPSTPKDLTDELSIHFPQISCNLKQMCERGLIQCLTENRKKGKVYSITEKGIEVLEKL